MATPEGHGRGLDTERAQWGPGGLWGPAVAIHAVLGALFFGAPTLLTTSSPARLNPETTIVIASAGAFLLGVLLVLAYAIARRLAEGSEQGWQAALGIGLVGPLVYGLAGSTIWGMASLLSESGEPVLTLYPAIYAGVAAPFVAVFCAAVYVFLRRT